MSEHIPSPSHGKAKISPHLAPPPMLGGKTRARQSRKRRVKVEQGGAKFPSLVITTKTFKTFLHLEN